MAHMTESFEIVLMVRAGKPHSFTDRFLNRSLVMDFCARLDRFVLKRITALLA